MIKDLNNCKVTETTGILITELKKKILKQASIYKAENKKKNFKKYENANMKPSKKKKKQKKLKSFKSSEQI